MATADAIIKDDDTVIITLRLSRVEAEGFYWGQFAGISGRTEALAEDPVLRSISYRSNGEIRPSDNAILGVFLKALQDAGIRPDRDAYLVMKRLQLSNAEYTEGL